MMTRDLGPLPKGDRQDTLQQLSIKALRTILPEQDFLFRDERVDDKGVDGALEVKLNGSFTNCRSQVQLKSTDDDPKSFNTDGSCSESVSTANLNYLLNGTSPLYVMWISKLNELRFAWAHDVWRELDTKKPRWKEQDTFTIRFSAILDTAALTVIRERILDEAQLHRRIHETLSRSSLSEKVVVSIDTTTLANTDPNELYKLLFESGMTIVSSGYGKRVLELYALLNPHAAKEPRIQLVAAFASTNIGRYHEAKGYLAGAIIGLNSLSADDIQYAEYLSGACDYHLGRLTRAEYLKQESNWAVRLTGVRAAEHEMEVLRHERLTERQPQRKAQLLKKLRALADQIASSPEAHPPQKIQARLVVLTAEGDDLSAELLESSARVGMRADMGFTPGRLANEVVETITRQWGEWENRLAKLHQDAVNVGHPLLVADALTAKVSCHVTLAVTCQMIAMTRGLEQKPDQSHIGLLMRDGHQAIEVYRHAGNLAGEFQVKLLLADLQAIRGDEVGAKAIASEVLPVVRAMNYERLVAWAVSHLEENTTLHQIAATVARPPTIDQIALSQSDDAIREMARMTCEALGIPIERLPLVEKDVFAGRYIAQERRDWCRHLELLQQLGHTQRAETAYEIDPERICICLKLGHESEIALSDYEVVIAAFKCTYCDVCKDRSPGGS
jgi:hypothetical protein